MTGADKPNGNRMVADRFRRIWSIVQKIADEPGHSRGELARIYSLSERQVQADLNIIRGEMRLPLVKSRGYRFADESGAYVGSGALDFMDLLALVGVLEAARRSGFEAGDALAVKLARLVPLHLQPLARELFLGEHREHLRRIAAATLDRDGSSVLIRGTGWPVGVYDHVKPELIMPYLGEWFILGEDVKLRRNRMWAVNLVASVEPVAIRIERKTRGAA